MKPLRSVAISWSNRLRFTTVYETTVTINAGGGRGREKSGKKKLLRGEKGRGGNTNACRWTKEGSKADWGAQLESAITGGGSKGKLLRVDYLPREKGPDLALSSQKRPEKKVEAAEIRRLTRGRRVFARKKKTGEINEERK